MEITEEFKKKSEEALEHGTRFAFIPHRLEIEGRPELNNFSFNILFGSQTIRDGKHVAGYALYEPVLSTFTPGPVQRMAYCNKYSRDCWVVLEYDVNKHTYNGTKYVNGKDVGSAGGPEWKVFFVHLTMLGLTNGERCEFKDI